MAVAGRLGRVADLEHEPLGLGQVGLRQRKPPVVHVEQPAVVERPPLTDPVANPAKTGDDLPVRLERLLVAAEHGEDHRPLGFDGDGRRPRCVGTVEGGHGLLAFAGQHERPGQAEPGLGGQVGIAGPLGGFHRGPQMDKRLGNAVAGAGGHAEGTQGG